MQVGSILNHALQEATERGDIAHVRHMIALRANVHNQNNLALRVAVRRGHTEMVKQLLMFKADVHACGADGKPDVAMCCAAIYGHTETIRVLLEHKAAVHDGALGYTAENGETESLRLLLNHRATMQTCGSECAIGDLDGVLHRAAMRGRTNTVRFLLNYRTNGHSCHTKWNKEKSVRSAFFSAIVRDDHHTIETLILDGGADERRLPTSYTRRVVNETIDSVAFCMRFSRCKGMDRLRKLPGDLVDVSRFVLVRDTYTRALGDITGCCVDMCISILLYV